MASFQLPLLFLTLVLFAVSISADQNLDYICGLTKNKAFCLNLLKPYSNTTTEQLVQIIIDTTISNATATNAKIQSLLARPADPALKLIYTTCSKDYTGVLSLLKIADNKLKLKLYNDVVVASTVAEQVAAMCYQAFGNMSPQGIPIYDDTNNFQKLSNVLVVVATILARTN